MARVLFDTALLESGFDLEAPKAFNARVYELMAGAYGIKGDLTVSPADAEAAAAADDVRPPPSPAPPCLCAADIFPRSPDLAGCPARLRCQGGSCPGICAMQLLCTRAAGTCYQRSGRLHCVCVTTPCVGSGG